MSGELAEMEALAKAATPGPWGIDTRYGLDDESIWTTAIASEHAYLFDSLCDGVGRIDREGDEDQHGYDGQARDNARFIVWLVNIAPRLIRSQAERIARAEASPKSISSGDSFWVHEWASEPEGGPPRYWSGYQKGWVYTIDDAIRYVDRADVLRSKFRSLLQGEPVEHSYIGHLTLSDLLRRAHDFICVHRKSGDYYGATDELLEQINVARAAIAKAQQS